jgi:hypothetical protein
MKHLKINDLFFFFFLHSNDIYGRIYVPSLSRNYCSTCFTPPSKPPAVYNRGTRALHHISRVPGAGLSLPEGSQYRFQVHSAYKTQWIKFRASWKLSSHGEINLVIRGVTMQIIERKINSDPDKIITLVLHGSNPQSSSTLWNYSKCGVYTVESEAGC